MNRPTRPPKQSRKQKQPTVAYREYDSPRRLLRPPRRKPALDELILGHAGLPRGAEPLAAMNYADELGLKREALTEFARQHKLPAFAGIIPSPTPRFYRTTTKRRVVITHRGAALTFGDEQPAGGYSLLEPDEHGRIYEFIGDFIGSRAMRKFAASLSHVILRGSYTEFCLIFNISRRSAALSALLTGASRELSRHIPELVSALEFLDETRSDYYLDSEAKSARGAWKRLFGTGVFDVPAGSVVFRAPATVFSQVNQSMLPLITAEVARLLRPEGRPLVDLFCGYGLFALSLAPECGRVTGIEGDAQAVVAAKKNAERLGAANARFFGRYISDETFAELLPYGRTGEIFVLDPPRQGVGAEVIEATAGRKPHRVAHIFCNIEELPAAVAAWHSHGYEPETLVPFDMFAGTPALEILAVFAPR